MALARAELPDAEFFEHDDGSPCFRHEGVTWTTGWPLADQKDWQFFRLAEGNLASALVTEAKRRTLDGGIVAFDYDAFKFNGGGRLADLEAFCGACGWMKVSKLTLKSAGREVEHLLATARTDDGRVLDARCVDRMFLLPASDSGNGAGTPPQADLDALEASLKAARLSEAGRENDRWIRFSAS